MNAAIPRFELLIEVGFLNLSAMVDEAAIRKDGSLDLFLEGETPRKDEEREDRE